MSASPQSGLPANFTFSQSCLQDYADCPRRFQLRYIEQLAWPAIESEPALEYERQRQEGQVFHRLAQQVLIGLPAERLARLANTENLKRWWRNFQTNLIHLTDQNGETNLHPELTLCAPLGAYRLTAKYDLVAIQRNSGETEKQESRATIYDWKTNRKRPKNEWMAARMQTRVYRSLLVAAGAHLNGGGAFAPEQIEMVYWYADFPNEPAKFRYDAAQFKRDTSALTKLVGEIASASDYPPSADDAQCRFCVYRSYCNRGAAAGDWQNSEAEAEAEQTLDINFEQIGEIAF